MEILFFDPFIYDLSNGKDKLTLLSISVYNWLISPPNLVIIRQWCSVNIAEDRGVLVSLRMVIMCYINPSVCPSLVPFTPRNVPPGIYVSLHLYCLAWCIRRLSWMMRRSHCMESMCYRDAMLGSFRMEFVSTRVAWITL